jgi:hypothetical protein
MVVELPFAFEVRRRVVVPPLALDVTRRVVVEPPLAFEVRRRVVV